MNAKVEETGGGAANLVKLVASVLVLAAGIAAFYALTDLAAPVRAAIVVVAVIVALGVFALTAQGRRARDYVAESNFELRKVVWPTRQETVQTTVVIVIVVIIISIVLWLIDMLLGWVILDNLMKAG